MRQSAIERFRKKGIYVQPFTDLQWYLARSQNTIHMATFTKNALSKSEVSLLVETSIMRAPELKLAESVKYECHHEVEDFSPIENLEYETVDQLDIDPRKWMLPRQGEYADNQRSAYKVWYVAAKQADKDGNKGFLLAQTTHALSEGSDLGAILRDTQTTRPDTRQESDKPSLLSKLTLVTLAPLAALAHLFGALFEKKKKEDFEFLSLTADSAQLAKAAKKLGLKRKTFLFAAVLFSVTKPLSKNGKQLFAYSALPKQKIKLGADEFLKLQMQLLPFKGSDQFVDFAKELEAAIDKQMASGTFTQLFYNQVLVVQRFINRYLPFLYHKKFFGQAPYDMVLSLLPPVRPRGAFSALADNPIFAGSYTGTVPSCIFVAGTKYTTFNFWLHETHKPHIPNVLKLLDECGIETQIFE